MLRTVPSTWHIISFKNKMVIPWGTIKNSFNILTVILLKTMTKMRAAQCARYSVKCSVYTQHIPDTHKIFLDGIFEYSCFVYEALERLINFYKGTFEAFGTRDLNLGNLTPESILLITKIHCIYLIANGKCSINVCWMMNGWID